MSQRALVTGGTGLLGRQVIKAFENAGWEVTGTGFSRASPPKVLKVDVHDEAAVAKILSEVKPQVVVHCAADRQPDSCTRNPEAAHRLNVIATESLARACHSHEAFFIYISTDYVFPGTQGDAPYKAADPTNPPNIYGETKRDGENAVLRTTRNAVVLRVPVLYGIVEPEGNNKESAVNVLMDALQKSLDKTGDDRVKMDDWAIRYPTNVTDVGRVCVDVGKYYISHKGQEDLPKILQFSSEDKMTKYEICQKFAEIMDVPTDGLVADKDGGKLGPDGTMRPYDCHLDTSELKKLGIDITTVDFVAWWRRQVKAFRR